MKELPEAKKQQKAQQKTHEMKQADTIFTVYVVVGVFKFAQ